MTHHDLTGDEDDSDDQTHTFTNVTLTCNGEEIGEVESVDVEYDGETASFEPVPDDHIDAARTFTGQFTVRNPDDILEEMITKGAEEARDDALEGFYETLAGYEQ